MSLDGVESKDSVDKTLIVHMYLHNFKSTITIPKICDIFTNDSDFD